ncbi:MAG: hypothetical protein JWL69_4395 [Phycisphaerales bacterium]|nr:hypothetical protein [Phycisphaerales bacterium]
MQGFAITINGREAEAHSFDHSIVIGRSADADLPLGDTEASRHHCRIEASDEGWVVTDLASRNGTFVGKERVNRRLLDNGDAVRIGRTTLHFTGNVAAAIENRPDTIAGAADMEAEALRLLTEPAPGLDDSFAGVTALGEGEGSVPDDSTEEEAPLAPNISNVPASPTPTVLRGSGSLWEAAIAPATQGANERAAKQPRAAAAKAVPVGQKLASLLSRLRRPDGNSDEAWHRRSLPAPVFVAAAGITLTLIGWSAYSAVFSGPKRPAMPAHAHHAQARLEDE